MPLFHFLSRYAAAIIFAFVFDIAAASLRRFLHYAITPFSLRYADYFLSLHADYFHYFQIFFIDTPLRHYAASSFRHFRFSFSFHFASTLSSFATLFALPMIAFFADFRHY
jgi:hypothetical protein